MRTAEWTDAVSVLDRITAVFDAFGPYDEGLGVSEVARRAGVPKSTVSRIAADLVEERLLDREGDKFYLGVRLFELGQSVEHPRRLRRLAHPVLGELRRASELSAQFAILDGADVVYLAIAREETVVQPAARIGGRLPAHATALGKAMLAFSPADVVDRALASGLEPRTPHTITDVESLRGALRLARAGGTAVEAEECVLGRSCVAAPVLVAGVAVAAVSVAGRSADVVSERLAPLVRTAASTLARRLAEDRAD